MARKGYKTGRKRMVKKKPPKPRPLINALEMISAQREHQKSQDYDADHDDEHDNGDLATAAACHLLCGLVPDSTVEELYPQSMLEDDEDDGIDPVACDYIKRHSRLVQLARAGALVVSEMESLSRMPPKYDKRRLANLRMNVTRVSDSVDCLNAAADSKDEVLQQVHVAATRLNEAVDNLERV